MINKFLSGVVFILTILAYSIFCVYLPIKSPHLFQEIEHKADITVRPGMTAQEVVSAMKKTRLIECPYILLKQMRFLGIDKKLKPGVYTLRSGLEINVARQLSSATPKDIKFMLVPGARYMELSDAFDKSDGKGCFRKEILDNSNFPAALAALLPVRAEDRIAFLLPETYFLVPDRHQARQFVRRAAALWFERLMPNGVDPNKTDKSKLFKLAIIASIVENEAKKAEERPILAGIFIKRIEKFMPLQSCATIVFCWREKGIDKRRLTYKDLQIDSPYNTYKNLGLPPGPICAPSESSWKSTITPEFTEYLFFFAADDGHHIFSKTYQEHIRKQKAN